MERTLEILCGMKKAILLNIYIYIYIYFKYKNMDVLPKSAPFLKRGRLTRKAPPF
jgi:hypothetical protein